LPPIATRNNVTFDWPTILPAAFAAFVFSFLGSRTVALLNTAFLRPVVLVLLIVVAIYVFFVKTLGIGWTGHIMYAYAIPMALCNVLGAALGTRVAIAKGSRFVRLFFLVVVAGLIAKLAQSMIAP
jgi:uncharacterized membrane protein YfcA